MPTPLFSLLDCFEGSHAHNAGKSNPLPNSPISLSLQSSDKYEVMIFELRMQIDPRCIVDQGACQFAAPVVAQGPPSRNARGFCHRLIFDGKVQPTSLDDSVRGVVTGIAKITYWRTVNARTEVGATDEQASRKYEGRSLHSETRNEFDDRS